MFIAAALALALRSLAQGEAPTHPPAVEKKVDAVYPAGARSDKEVTVMVRVTVTVDGSAAMPEIVESGGPAFDAAALVAIEQWKFRPAMRDGAPVSSRVRIPFLFPAQVAAAPDGGVAVAPTDAGVSVPPVVTAADAGVAVPLPEVTQVPAPEAAQPPPPEPEPPPAAESRRQRADGGEETIEVTGHAAARRRAAPSRGTSDFQIETAQLAEVPHANASEFLKLAPGILLTNEGGEGHAEQVFLRGFDAREGQDIEFSVDGVPINESGNLHGNGYADTHFIIPELVESLRVVEGPFDPRQGNYAVAGSADYHLGLAERGLTAKLSDGSFGTQRAAARVRAAGREQRHVRRRRDLPDATATARTATAKRHRPWRRYEGRQRRERSYRVTAQAYTAQLPHRRRHPRGRLPSGPHRLLRHLRSAAGRGRVALLDRRRRWSRTRDHIIFSNQVFVIERPLRLRENFTGFLLDVQEPLQQPHGQRGDLIDLNVIGDHSGARGSARWSAASCSSSSRSSSSATSRAATSASGLQQRIEAATGAPLPHRDQPRLRSSATSASTPTPTCARSRWLALRGGVRGDLFTYDVHEQLRGAVGRAPVRTIRPEPDVCLQRQQNFGALPRARPARVHGRARRSCRARRSSSVRSGGVVVLRQRRAGRALDRSQSTSRRTRTTPFASITAYEGGVTFERRYRPTCASVCRQHGLLPHARRSRSDLLARPPAATCSPARRRGSARPTRCAHRRPSSMSAPT